jgi:hypothetical protein
MAIKQEEIRTYGTAIYCDGCRARGPQAVGEDAQGVSDEAESRGWRVSDSGDFCPKCALRDKK